MISDIAALSAARFKGEVASLKVAYDCRKPRSECGKISRRHGITASIIALWLVTQILMVLLKI